MNLYHCMIDLTPESKALVFARAIEEWMAHLSGQGLIGPWRLMRRKLNLASDAHRDFLLQIEVDSLERLDRLFQYISTDEDQVDELHWQVHRMIAAVEFGLYRPYPDEGQVERAAIL